MIMPDTCNKFVDQVYRNYLYNNELSLKYRLHEKAFYVYSNIHKSIERNNMTKFSKK